MKKLGPLTIFLFFVFVGLVKAEIKDCRIGADPIDTNLTLQEGEVEYVLTEPAVVRMRGGSGKEYHCRLSAGEVLVVDTQTEKVKRVRNCGNTLLTDLFVKIRKEAEVESVRKTVEVVPEKKYECPPCPEVKAQSEVVYVAPQTTMVPFPYDRWMPPYYLINPMYYWSGWGYRPYGYGGYYGGYYGRYGRYDYYKHRRSPRYSLGHSPRHSPRHSPKSRRR